MELYSTSVTVLEAVKGECQPSVDGTALVSGFSKEPVLGTQLLAEWRAHETNRDQLL